jgi:hypothetical protein
MKRSRWKLLLALASAIALAILILDAKAKRQSCPLPCQRCLLSVFVTP